MDPLKDQLLIELIRAATIWTIWLIRNKLCFTDAVILTLSSIGSSIIFLASYWCKSNLDDSYFKLSLILPMDVTQLSQVGPLIILSENDTSQDENFNWDSEKEHFLGLEGPGLSDYLRDRA